jgi:hypothetical protein
VAIPTWVGASMFVVAALVEIHAFQLDPPRKPAFARPAQKVSAGVRVGPIVEITIPTLVENMMFMFGRKKAFVSLFEDMVSVQEEPCPSQSALHAEKRDGSLPVAVMVTL